MTERSFKTTRGAFGNTSCTLAHTSLVEGGRAVELRVGPGNYVLLNRRQALELAVDLTELADELAGD
jgi:hypothetical protein